MGAVPAGSPRGERTHFHDTIYERCPALFFFFFFLYNFFPT